MTTCGSRFRGDNGFISALSIPEKCLMGLRMMILNSKTMKLGKYFVIYHIYQGTAYAKCFILMIYISIREDCLVVVFSGDAPRVSIIVCILAVRIGETGVSWSMGKVVQDQFL